jgi:hypothetical protein
VNGERAVPDRSSFTFLFPAVTVKLGEPLGTEINSPPET